jgi:DNA mismatch endonuclease (patch repair protein)
MFELTSEQRHKNMSHIKCSNTSIEIQLRKALWREGIRYRINLKSLPGKPDIAITKYRIAIFCDGEFWHGKNWETRKKSIKTNRDYWIPKIERNMARDNTNEKKLQSIGWTVLRFWGTEINKNLLSCVNEIKEAIIEFSNEAYGNEQNYRIGLLAAENEPEYDNKEPL